MKKVEFSLNGKSVSVGGPGPQAQKFIAFVKEIPNGKYFDAEGIGKCLQMTAKAVEQIARKTADDITEYCIVVPRFEGSVRKKVFGSKASIVQLRKQLQESGLI